LTGASKASMRLTSLLLVEGRLLEAEYFLKRMARERGEAFGYNLNAFLSAARSVTLSLAERVFEGRRLRRVVGSRTGDPGR
jgi:hypothetical protein